MRFFFFNDTATTEIYTLSLHDALPILLVEEMDIVVPNPTNEGIGIDLGLKDFAICSNGDKFKNINKTSRVRKVEKKLKREQRKLSRKYESLKTRNKNIKGGKATRSEEHTSE